MEENKDLKRVLGSFDLFAIGFGAVIGWGWISMGSYWMTNAGSVGSMVTFVVIGLLMLIFAVIYAELSTAMPRAGGIQNFAWRAMGPKMAFITSFIFLANPVLMSGWLCYNFVGALDRLVPLSNTPLLYEVSGNPIYLGTLIAYIVFALLMGVLAYIGMNGLSRVQNAAVIGMIVVVVVFIVVAVFKGDTENMKPLFNNGAQGILMNAITSITFLAGFEAVPQSIEESKVSPKAIGKILIVVMVASSAWYILTFLAQGMVLPGDVIASESLVAIRAMEVLFNHPIAGKILIIVGILGLLTSWIALVIIASRMIFSMSRAGMMFDSFGDVHPKYGTPYKAVIATTVVTVLIGFLGGGVNVWLPNFTGLCTVFSYVVLSISFIILRKKEPNMERPYKAPGLWLGYAGTLLGVFLVIITLPGVPNTGMKWPYEVITAAIWAAIGIYLYIRTSKSKGGFERVDESMRALLEE